MHMDRARLHVGEEHECPAADVEDHEVAVRLGDRQSGGKGARTLIRQIGAAGGDRSVDGRENLAAIDAVSKAAWPNCATTISASWSRTSMSSIRIAPSVGFARCSSLTRWTLPSDPATGRTSLRTAATSGAS